nr:histone deacetylase 14 [Tanacetum cinerariifolium]
MPGFNSIVRAFASLGHDLGNMANKNIPGPAPTRSDDQILPFAAWVPIGKSNFVLDLQKKQKNPIFQISEAKTGAYRFQLDEDWFTLDANLLRKALERTPIDQAHQFESPPLALESNIVNDQLMSTDKTSGFDWPRYPVLQMLWGIVTRINVDNAELLWEEFVKAIQTFFADKVNLGSPTKKGKKTKPHVIPYCQFTKLIICHLGRKHNLHQRSKSPFHLAEEDLRLGNLKFVPKGEDDEVFGMKIPNDLITDNIRRAPYYKSYLEMVLKHERKIIAKKEGGKKKTAPKVDKPVKPPPAKQAKPVTARQTKPKPVKEKSTKPTPPQKASKGKVTKVQNVKSSLQLIDELDEEQNQPKSVPEPQGAGEEYDLERAIQMSLESFHAQGQAHVGSVAIREPVADATRPLLVVEGKGKAIRQTPATKDASTGPSTQPQDDTSANIVREIPSPADAETCGDTDKAGSDPGETPESRPPPNDDKMDEDQAGSDPVKSHVAHAGSNPEPMHDDFVATVYPKEKNVDAEVVSMVTVPIHQASTSVPPLSTPIIDLSPLKLVDSPLLEPFIAATTETTTTTLLLSPPLQQQSTIDSELAARVTTLEKKFSNLEYKSQILDNTTQNLRSRVFTLELRDLPHKINQTVNEVVKEVAHVAFQASLRDCFRELPEADMKEILHQRMFESGSYKSLPKHVALYEALEASMKRENRDEFLAKKDKSRKRRRDDQDPPPPPASDLSKKKRHDSDASGSKQPPALYVISIRTFERYGYAYLREIVIRRVDYNEYKILEADFKNLHLNDFEYLYMLYLQGKLNHLPGSEKVYLYNAINSWIKNIVIKQHIRDLQLGIESYQTKLNLTKPRWDASELLFKKDYTIVSKPRAVIYKDRNDQKKMLSENEVHKFSNGTLKRVLYKLDHMVKDFRLYEYNSGMENEIWFEDDKRRSEEFMEVIKRRLKI